MRLIYTLEQNSENPFALSYYLKAQGIENECEEVEAPLGKPSTFRIWVFDEDKVKEAENICREYQDNPHDPRYRAHYEKIIDEQEAKVENHSPVEEQEKKGKETMRRSRILSPAPYGPVSIIILITVVSLFLWVQFQREKTIPPKLPGIIQAPFLAPVERVLLYDYPLYFQSRDELLKIYTAKDIKEKIPPSPQARLLMREIRNIPVWMGFYEVLVNYFRNPERIFSFSAPMFEQIRQGEVWRIFTPALLHLDLLHIFFNLLWFILLGNQIEFRLGPFRYLLLIIIAAIISNTAQYLMSGPFFMGLSGVITAFAGFIWARQQIAPWEGYLLHRFTLIFLAIFVVGMFLLQVVYFFVQIFGNFQLHVNIANTAHLTGAIVGYLLGRMRFFALRHKKY